jgi:hypothetical protein
MNVAFFEVKKSDMQVHGKLLLETLTPRRNVLAASNVGKNFAVALLAQPIAWGRLSFSALVTFHPPLHIHSPLNTPPPASPDKRAESSPPEAGNQIDAAWQHPPSSPASISPVVCPGIAGPLLPPRRISMHV